MQSLSDGQDFSMRLVMRLVMSSAQCSHGKPAQVVLDKSMASAGLFPAVVAGRFRMSSFLLCYLCF